MTNSYNPSDFAIWWTSQSDCECIGVLLQDIRDENGALYDFDYTLTGIRSDYIFRELRSRTGRSGRGRLWISRELPLPGIFEIEWRSEKPAVMMINFGNHGGIVIWSKDVPQVQRLPGFVTDLEMNLLGGKLSIEVGKTYRIDFGEGNPNNKTIHVRAIVDDCHVVCRVWHNRIGWTYNANSVEYFRLLEENGHITEAK